MKQLFLGAALLALTPLTTSAQVTFSHDTLSTGSPVAVSCGFCAGERYGVVFRDLPAPSRGLEGRDFPLTLRSLQVAVASATVTGTAGAYSCGGSADGSAALVDVEVWAGVTPPVGSIRTLSATGGWADDEVLVWGGVDVPLRRSVDDGAGSFVTSFNELMLLDEMEMPLRVEGPSTYLRVVVSLNSGDGSSASCADASLEAPTTFPLRDDDMVVNSERAFIYAAGVGWLWNEEAGINGDWAVRVEVSPSSAPPVMDGGTPIDDGGVVVDASVEDAGMDDGAIADSSAPDGGAADSTPEPPGGGGGGCTISSGASDLSPSALVGLLALALLRRRRLR